jgi:hypothetical protein
MLRVLYGCVLRAHPRYFRERFAAEMQSIFDHTESKFAAAGLLADALLSLARQWTLRPQYWEEPSLAATADGAPFFCTLGTSKPHTAALASGAFLSVLVLNGVCWTMGYAWNHPRFMDIRPGYGPSGRVPESKLISRPVHRSPVVAEPPLQSDQGRVLLVFQSPVRPATSPANQVKPSPPVPTASAAPTAEAYSPTSPAEARWPPRAWQSYTGRYVSKSAGSEKVNITIEGERLHLEVVGKFRSALVPLPKPQLLACSVGDRRVAFSTNASGTVDRIEIHHSGGEIEAFRVQGAVF